MLLQACLRGIGTDAWRCDQSRHYPRGAKTQFCFLSKEPVNRESRRPIRDRETVEDRRRPLRPPAKTLQCRGQYFDPELARSCSRKAGRDLTFRPPGGGYDLWLE